MKELKRILAEYEKVDLKKGKAALATVVHVNGSSYRRPGATMLLLYSGRWFGSVSGGCLEGDVLRKAREAMDARQPRYVVYDTSDESQNPFGVKLGCNGVIEILIEPLERKGSPLDLIKQNESAGEEFVMAMVYKANGALKNELGKRKIRFKNGNDQTGFSPPSLDVRVNNDIQEMYARRKSFIREYRLAEGSVEILYRLIQPQPRLFVFGGGMDVQPVVQLAKTLNWYTVVTDDCVSRMVMANSAGADEAVFCPREEICDEFRFNKQTAAVIMSHSFEYDKAVLRKLIRAEMPYIGLLGPQKRTAEIVENLRKEGAEIPEEVWKKRIHAPVGLDIGSETPQEIALSIISEIQACFSGRQGGHLKLRDKPIHDRDEHEELPAVILK